MSQLRTQKNKVRALGLRLKQMKQQEKLLQRLVLFDISHLQCGSPLAPPVQDPGQVSSSSHRETQSPTKTALLHALSSSPLQLLSPTILAWPQMKLGGPPILLQLLSPILVTVPIQVPPPPLQLPLPITARVFWQPCGDLQLLSPMELPAFIFAHAFV